MMTTDYLTSFKAGMKIPQRFSKSISKEDNFKNSFFSYDFSPWKLSSSQLEILFLEPFHYYDLMKRFDLSENLMISFYRQVSNHYISSNDFHNFLHAFSVYQNIFSLLIHGYDSMLTDFDILCLLIASLCHDIGHTGKNSAFEVATNSEICSCAKDNLIVMELYHVRLTKELITKTQILSSLSEEEEQKFFNIIEKIILSTAMSDHNNLVSNSKDLFSVIETCNIYKKNSFSSDSCSSRQISKKKSFFMSPEADSISCSPSFISSSPIFDSPSFMKRKFISQLDSENYDTSTDLSSSSSSFYSNFSKSPSSNFFSKMTHHKSALVIDVDNELVSNLKSATTTRSSLETDVSCDTILQSCEDDFLSLFNPGNFLDHERLSDDNIREIYDEGLRIKLLKLLMHSSDLSGQTQSSSLAVTWSQKCYNEFLKQAKVEQDLGIVTSPFLHDLDSKKKRASSQIIFINQIVSPLWDIIINIMPSLSFVRENIKSNLKIYEEILEV